MVIRREKNSKIGKRDEPKGSRRSRERKIYNNKNIKMEKERKWGSIDRENKHLERKCREMEIMREAKRRARQNAHRRCLLYYRHQCDHEKPAGDESVGGGGGGGTREKKNSKRKKKSTIEKKQMEKKKKKAEKYDRQEEVEKRC
uniref:Uncharacterized protein n=1 Tax=Octopus bimaculoides TaxID=37653 RepID=A0A0L8HD22_OCTBM